MAETTKSASGSVATLDGACGAVDDFDAGDSGGFRRAASWAASSSVASETIFGRQRTACAKASSTFEPAAKAMGRKRSGKRLADAEGALADGAGRAEDGNLLHWAILRGYFRRSVR